MAPSLRKAIEVVKDRTSISLAKANSNNFFADLDVAILKATRHGEHPASEKYIREIIATTLCSRAHVSSCVHALAKRLNKTKDWTVALKTLMLIQRLLTQGDPNFEKEIFSTTRRGTRLLNMSDFHDRKRPGSWDYSVYVRSYALYLDEQLEFRMHTRCLQGGDDKKDIRLRKQSSSVPVTIVHEMKNDHILSRTQLLQQLMERFLACRPSGSAKINRVVLTSLHPIVKESFQMYKNIIETMNILIERFMDLEVRYCMKVHEIFSKMSKQFDELDAFYRWCKSVGLIRCCEYPEVDQIEQKKIDLMDEIIRDKIVLAQGKQVKCLKPESEQKPNEEKVTEDTNETQASPPPKEIREVVNEEKKQEIEEEKNENGENKTKQETNLLDIGDPQEENQEDPRDKWALALIDIGTPKKKETQTPEWVAFTSEDIKDWETTLLQSSSVLQNQTPTHIGGLDLDEMYQQYTKGSTLREAWGATTTASSAAVGSNWTQQGMLALPAPSISNNYNALVLADPFSASQSVAAPTYVQMSEMDLGRKMLIEEQQMWQYYAMDGVQGHLGMQPYSYGMVRGYNHM